jgi:hypothetical protein
MHKGWAEALDENAPARFEGLFYTAFNTVTQAQVRIGAIPLIRKAALGIDARRRYAAKSHPTKSVVSSQETETVGVTRPLQSLAVLAMQIYALNATAPLRGQMRPRQANRPSVGAPADPRYGCAVTAVECDSGLARLHRSKVVPLLVALTGGELCLKEK